MLRNAKPTLAGLGSISTFPNYLPRLLVNPTSSTNKPVTGRISLLTLDAFESVKLSPNSAGPEIDLTRVFKVLILLNFSMFLLLRTASLIRRSYPGIILHHWYWAAQFKTSKSQWEIFPLSSEDFGSVLRDFCQNPVEVFRHRNKSYPQ